MVVDCKALDNLMAETKKEETLKHVSAQQQQQQKNLRGTERHHSTWGRHTRWWHWTRWWCTQQPPMMLQMFAFLLHSLQFLLHIFHLSFHSNQLALLKAKFGVYLQVKFLFKNQLLCCVWVFLQACFHICRTRCFSFSARHPFFAAPITVILDATTTRKTINTISPPVFFFGYTNPSAARRRLINTLKFWTVCQNAKCHFQDTTCSFSKRSLRIWFSLQTIRISACKPCSFFCRLSTVWSLHNRSSCRLYLMCAHTHTQNKTNSVRCADDVCHWAKKNLTDVTCNQFYLWKVA